MDGALDFLDSTADGGGIDALRATEYRMFGLLLTRPPNHETLTALARIAGDATPLGAAHSSLAAAAARAEPSAVARDFFELFVGVGRGKLLPYASYYLTGFLNERPLAAIRRDLGAIGLERVEGMTEPEDHLPFLLDTMAALAREDVARPAVNQKTFFLRHLEPWAGRCFVDLAEAGSTDLYRAIGEAGAVFLALETRAFALEDG